RVEFIGTLMEGILAISPDGKIVGANRGALEQLGMSGAALRMHTLTTLLGTTVGALVDAFRSPVATPVAVHMNNGRQFHGHARCNWPVWSSVGDGADEAARSSEAMVEAAVAAVGTTTRPAADAPRGERRAGLAQLQTGDPQVGTVIEKIRRVIDR